MITRQSRISAIGIADAGHLEVRRSDTVYDDGELIATSYHRHVVSPGDSLDDQDAIVRAVAFLVHSPSVVARYRQRVEDDRRANDE